MNVSRPTAVPSPPATTTPPASDWLGSLAGIPLLKKLGKTEASGQYTATTSNTSSPTEVLTETGTVDEAGKVLESKAKENTTVRQSLATNTGNREEIRHVRRSTSKKKNRTNKQSRCSRHLSQYAINPREVSALAILEAAVALPGKQDRKHQPIRPLDVMMVTGGIEKLLSGFSGDTDAASKYRKSQRHNQGDRKSIGSSSGRSKSLRNIFEHQDKVEASALIQGGTAGTPMEDKARSHHARFGGMLTETHQETGNHSSRDLQRDNSQRRRQRRRSKSKRDGEKRSILNNCNRSRTRPNVTSERENGKKSRNSSRRSRRSTSRNQCKSVSGTIGRSKSEIKRSSSRRYTRRKRSKSHERSREKQLDAVQSKNVRFEDEGAEVGVKTDTVPPTSVLISSIDPDEWTEIQGNVGQSNASADIKRTGLRRVPPTSVPVEAISKIHDATATCTVRLPSRPRSRSRSRSKRMHKSESAIDFDHGCHSTNGKGILSESSRMHKSDTVLSYDRAIHEKSKQTESTNLIHAKPTARKDSSQSRHSPLGQEETKAAIYADLDKQHVKIREQFESLVKNMNDVTDLRRRLEELETDRPPSRTSTLHPECKCCGCIFSFLIQQISLTRFSSSRQPKMSPQNEKTPNL